MNLLAWICQGLRNCRVVGELVKIVQVKGVLQFLVVGEGAVWLCYGGMKM